MRPIPTLKISVSGVRGVIGDSLTPEMVVRFAQAFGTYVGGGRVVIGRDPRTSGEMVRQSVIAGLVSSGCRVSDIGVCPTPAVQLLVRQLEAAGLRIRKPVQVASAELRVVVEAIPSYQAYAALYRHLGSKGFTADIVRAAVNATMDSSTDNIGNVALEETLKVDD